MPLPFLALGIGAAVSGVGAYGLNRVGRRSFEDSSFNNPASEAMSMFERLSDPTYGLDYFRQVATDTAPTAQTFLRVQAAQGGSPLIAQEQLEAARRTASEQALSQFRQFRLGADQNAGDYLRTFYSQEQFNQQMFQQRQAERRQFWGSLLNQGLNIAGVGLAQYGAGRQFGGGQPVGPNPGYQQGVMYGMQQSGVGARLPTPNFGGNTSMTVNPFTMRTGTPVDQRGQMPGFDPYYGRNY